MCIYSHTWSMKLNVSHNNNYVYKMFTRQNIGGNGSLLGSSTTNLSICIHTSKKLSLAFSKFSGILCVFSPTKKRKHWQHLKKLWTSFLDVWQITKSKWDMIALKNAESNTDEIEEVFLRKGWQMTMITHNQHSQSWWWEGRILQTSLGTEEVEEAWKRRQMMILNNIISPDS